MKEIPRQNSGGGDPYQNGHKIISLDKKNP
jgi:hypothetical protein